MHIRETRKPRLLSPAPLRQRRWALAAALLALLSQARAEPFGLELRSGEGEWQPGLVMDTQVDMRVTGLLAKVTVSQRFRNDSTQWQEGRYLLPLPGDAAVGELRIRVGERLIEGEVQEKEAAQKTFQQATAAGQRAALVEQNRPNLFRTAVANIAPGETVDVEIGYWQRVEYRDGEFALGLPLTYTPRYRAEGSAVDSAVAGPEPALATGTEASAAEPTFSLSAELEAGLPLQEVTSPSHRITVEKAADPSRARLRLQDWAEASDRDVELRWRPQPSAEPRQAVFAEASPLGQYAMLMLVPPSLPAPAMPRELILVVDHSGSMMGTSMEQAKAALDASLSQLRPQDRFNLIKFDDDSEAFQPQPVQADPAAVALARAWVGELQAEGGTEMAGALRLALADAPAAGYLRQVVLVTDAAIGNENALLAQIEQDLGDSRLFTVGIGSAPNDYFIRRAAELGRGSHELVRDLTQVAPRMATLFKRIDSPLLRELEVQWPGIAEAYPQRIPDLYAGEPLQLLAKVDALAGQVAVSAQGPKSRWQQRIDLALGKRGELAGIGRLWARAKLESLDDALRQGADAEQIREQSVALAIEHQLASRYTSLVAVERVPVRPDGAELASTRIDNAIPAGSLAMAAGATSARGQLGAAIALLLVLAALTRRESRIQPGIG